MQDCCDVVFDDVRSEHAGSVLHDVLLTHTFFFTQQGKKIVLFFFPQSTVYILSDKAI